MSKTNIEYLTHTWNPIVMRCNRVSEGCRNCWHLRMCDRMAKNPMIPVWKQDIYAGNAEPQIDEKALVQPIHLNKPAIIGVQFMGDLFHESVHNEMIKDVFEVIKNEPRHTFLVLTKRPKRMFDLSLEINYRLPNLWLGVSVEDQESANERIPALLETQAAHRWVSVEPIIAPVDLTRIDCSAWETTTIINALNGRMVDSDNHCQCDKLDWVVSGSESGPNARSMKMAWVVGLMNHCKQFKTPFFYKQGPGDNEFFGSMPKLEGKVRAEKPYER